LLSLFRESLGAHAPRVNNDETPGGGGNGRVSLRKDYFFNPLVAKK